MPRKCTICNHPKRVEIDKALASPSRTLRSIEQQFKVGNTVAMRHRDRCLIPAMQKLRSAKGSIAQVREAVEVEAFVDAAKAQARNGTVASVISVERLMGKLVEGIMKLYDAVERDLSDPENPHEFSLGPRASEIKIVYEVLDGDSTDPENRRWVKRKGTLQEVLDMAFANGDIRLVRNEQIVHNDRADLLLKCVDRMSQNADLLAKMQGLYRPVEQEFGKGDTIQLAVLVQIMEANGIRVKK